MAKKVTGYIKLQIPAGKATPAPPVGPALGQHGVNIVEFTKQCYHPCCNYRLCGQKLQLHYQDSARCCIAEEGMQSEVCFCSSEQDKGCYDFQGQGS